jgi:hypothetical protein
MIIIDILNNRHFGMLDAQDISKSIRAKETVMKNRFKILTVAYLVAFIGVSLNSQFALAQDADGNNFIQPLTIEEKALTRSPWGAVGLSLGSTALFSAIGGGMLASDSFSVRMAGIAIAGTGLVFGPSVGQAYSDRWGKAALFSLGRAGFGTMFAIGLAETYRVCLEADCQDRDRGGMIALAVIGGAATLGLGVWSIVDSYNSAQQYNEEHAKKSISLSPFVIPSSGRNGENGMAYGLAVAGRF